MKNQNIKKHFFTLILVIYMFSRIINIIPNNTDNKSVSETNETIELEIKETNTTESEILPQHDDPPSGVTG